MAAHSAPRVSVGVRLRGSLVTLAERWAPAVGTMARTAPGALGALAVSVGSGMVYAPAGVIVAGLFLLAIDRGMQ